MSRIILNHIGKKLATLARLKEKKQIDLAVNIDIGAPQLNKFFQGSSDMKTEKFVLLLRELDIDLLDLINNKIAEVSGLSYTKPSIGSVIDKLSASLNLDKRHSMMDFLTVYAEFNTSNGKLKEEIKSLRNSSMGGD
ncbi:MAG TPA: hypothetical protein PLJ21_07985 [Pseudobdellovibrionaceae bacterium]|nr:hypothetical protein [Pseudobdellovibrionaceae bacterium]